MRTTLALVLAGCSGDKDTVDTDAVDTDAPDTDTTPTGETGTPPPDVYEPTWTGVQQLFVEHCDACHPAEQGLDLHTELQYPSTSGYNYVVPGDPENSLLWAAVTYEYLSPRMPPQGQLPAETIQAIYDWILAGAVFE